MRTWNRRTASRPWRASRSSALELFEDPFADADAAAEEAGASDALLPITGQGTDITSRILAKHAHMKASGTIRRQRVVPPTETQSAVIEPFTTLAPPGMEELLEQVDRQDWLNANGRERLRTLLKGYANDGGGALPHDIFQRLEASCLLNAEQAGLLETALADQRIVGRHRLGQVLAGGSSVRRYGSENGRAGPGPGAGDAHRQPQPPQALPGRGAAGGCAAGIRASPSCSTPMPAVRSAGPPPAPPPGTASSRRRSAPRLRP